MYNVPRTTIDNHIQGHSRSHQRGRPSFFTREQEQNIICLINALNHYGYPPDKVKLKEIAAEFARKLNITFRDSLWRPGEDWLNK